MLIWSAVFRLSVSREARKRRVLSLSKRPTEVLELPTSMASSMESAPFVPVLPYGYIVARAGPPCKRMTKKGLQSYVCSGIMKL